MSETIDHKAPLSPSDPAYYAPRVPRDSDPTRLPRLGETRAHRTPATSITDTTLDGQLDFSSGLVALADPALADLVGTDDWLAAYGAQGIAPADAAGVTFRAALPGTAVDPEGGTLPPGSTEYSANAGDPAVPIAVKTLATSPEIREAQELEDFIADFAPSLFLSSVVLHELLVGSNTSAKAKQVEDSVAAPLKRVGRVITPSHAAWESAGNAIARMARDERLDLRSVPKSLVHDFLIAASCREAGVTVITDNMAGHVMKNGKVDAVVVGADRIAANGDTANKIGTYMVAVLAREHVAAAVTRPGRREAARNRPSTDRGNRSRPFSMPRARCG